jgi:hypothetical protein
VTSSASCPRTRTSRSNIHSTLAQRSDIAKAASPALCTTRTAELNLLTWAHTHAEDLVQTALERLIAAGDGVGEAGAMGPDDDGGSS